MRGRRREPLEGPSRHDDYFIWIGGLIVPVRILVVLAFVTVHTGAALRQPSKDDVPIDVVGRDWWWEVDYTGQNVTTANELHVPVGQPLDITLVSDDVVHSFWVPQLAGKEDVIPGQTNTLRFTVNRVGVYRGMCAEFCGIEHAHMGFDVIASRRPTTDLARARTAHHECPRIGGVRPAGNSCSPRTRAPDATPCGAPAQSAPPVPTSPTSVRAPHWCRNPR